MSGRWVFFILALCTASFPADAEDWVVRDTHGRVIERIVPGNAPDQLIRRDMSGRRIGTIEDTDGNNKILRDSSGRRIGTVERGANDDWIVRDSHGHRTETLRSEPSRSDYVRRDPSGKRLGTVEPR